MLYLFMDRRLIHIKTHVFLEIFKMYALNDCQMELSYKKKMQWKTLANEVFFNDEETYQLFGPVFEALVCNLYNKVLQIIFFQIWIPRSLLSFFFKLTSFYSKLTSLYVVENTAYRGILFRPGWVLDSRVHILKPGNGLISLLASLPWAWFHQVLWGVGWQ